MSPASESRMMFSASGTVVRSSRKLSSSSSFCRTSFARYCNTLVFLSKALASFSLRRASTLNPNARLPSPPVLIWFTSVRIMAMSFRRRFEFRTSWQALLAVSTPSCNSASRDLNCTLKRMASNLACGFFKSFMATMYFSHSGKLLISPPRR